MTNHGLIRNWKWGVALLLASCATANANEIDQAGCFDFAAECCDGIACEAAGCDGIGCDGSGCDACGGCGGSCLSHAWDDCCLTSLLRRSDHCFDDFISPMIDFVHFEDPRTLTEIRPIYVYQRFPGTLGPGNIPAGGDVSLFAMQFRIALTERLSLIAVKDGYIIDGSEGALDGLLDSGWADVTAGLKYNLIRNVQTGTLLSTGFTYEIPMGSEQALQAVSDGEFHFFASGGQRFLDGNAHYLTAFGWQLPVDQSEQTTSVHWQHHFDLRMTKKTYLFTELSWWHWTDDAENGQALGVAGLDLINLGSSNVDGNDVVTQNVGMKYKPNGNLEAGLAYEFPLTEFQDVIEDRWQFEMIFRF